MAVVSVQLPTLATYILHGEVVSRSYRIVDRDLHDITLCARSGAMTDNAPTFRLHGHRAEIVRVLAPFT